MTGEFSRTTFDQRHHYCGVLQQQGRVGVDADWNEWVEIVRQQFRTTTIDVVGGGGRPQKAPGFRVVVDPTQSPSTPVVTAGRFYAGGQLCELDRTVPLQSQPDWPVPDRAVWEALFDKTPWPGFSPQAATGRRTLFYLECLTRHLTALQDEARRAAQVITHGYPMRERALGGPDTCTRLQTVARVRHLQIPGEIDECAAAADELRHRRPLASTGRMQLQVAVHPPVSKPCETPQDGGYGGPEHRTYRLEIHDPGEPGKATFKWSLENGAFLVRIQDPGTGSPLRRIAAGTDLPILSLGLDQVTRLKRGDWVEVCGEETELGVFRNPLAEIIAEPVEQPDGIWHVQLSTAVVLPRAPVLRRWSGPLRTVQLDQPLPLDTLSGIQVLFRGAAATSARTTFTSQDFWTWVGRADIRELEPQEFVREPQTPVGPLRHYSCLAIYDWVPGPAGPTAQLVTECAHDFPPLTELPQSSSGGCCAIEVHDGRTSQGAFHSLAAALAAIPESGAVVCVAAGHHVIDQPLKIPWGRVVIRGCGPQSEIFAPHGAFLANGISDVAVVNLRISVSDGPVIRASDVRNLIVRDCELTVDSLTHASPFALLTVAGQGLDLAANRLIGRSVASSTWVTGIHVQSPSGQVVIRDCQFDQDLKIGVSVMGDDQQQEGKGVEDVWVSDNRFTHLRGAALLAGNARLGRLRHLRVTGNRIDATGTDPVEYEPRMALRSSDLAPGAVEITEASTVAVLDNFIRVGVTKLDQSALLIEHSEDVNIARNTIQLSVLPQKRFLAGVLLSQINILTSQPGDVSVLDNQVETAGGPALLALAVDGHLRISRNQWRRHGCELPSAQLASAAGAMVHVLATATQPRERLLLAMRSQMALASTSKFVPSRRRRVTFQENVCELWADAEVPGGSLYASLLLTDGELHISDSQFHVVLGSAARLSGNTLATAWNLRVLGNAFSEAFTGQVSSIYSAYSLASQMLTALGNQATHCLHLKPLDVNTRLAIGLNLEIDCPKVEFANGDGPTIDVRSPLELQPLDRMLRERLKRFADLQTPDAQAEVARMRSQVDDIRRSQDLLRRLAVPVPQAFTLQVWVATPTGRPIADCLVTLSGAGRENALLRLPPVATDVHGLATFVLPARQFPELKEQSSLFVRVASRRSELLFQSADPVAFQPGQVTILPATVEETTR